MSSLVPSLGVVDSEVSLESPLAAWTSLVLSGVAVAVDSGVGAEMAGRGRGWSNRFRGGLDRAISHRSAGGCLGLRRNR